MIFLVLPSPSQPLTIDLLRNRHHTPTNSPPYASQAPRLLCPCSCSCLTPMPAPGPLPRTPDPAPCSIVRTYSTPTASMNRSRLNARQARPPLAAHPPAPHARKAGTLTLPVPHHAPSARLESRAPSGRQSPCPATAVHSVHLAMKIARSARRVPTAAKRRRPACPAQLGTRASIRARRRFFATKDTSPPVDW